MPTNARTRRRRTTIVVAAVVLACLGGWYAWAWPPAPRDLGGYDPLVADAIRQALWPARLQPWSADARLKLGIVYEANGVLDLACECYRWVLRSRSDDAQAWYRLANAQYEFGEPEEALASVDRAIALDKQYAPLHWKRGFWLLDRGDDEEARVAFQSALTVDKHSAAAQAGLAKVHLHRGETESAIKILEALEFRRAEDRHIRRLLGIAFRQAGRLDDAEVQLALAGDTPANWPDPWSDPVTEARTSIPSILVTVKDLQARGQYSVTIGLLEPLCQRFPQHESLLYNLGLAYAGSGRTDDALRILEQARAAAPDSALIYSGLATTWIDKRDYAKALTLIDRAIALNPRAGFLHQNRAAILLKFERITEALMAYDTAFALEPQNATPMLWKGRTQLDRRDWRGARESFLAAVKSNPVLVAAFVALANADIELGLYEEARSALNRAASLNSAEPGLEAARMELERRAGAAASPQLDREQTKSGKTDPARP